MSSRNSGSGSTIPRGRNGRRGSGPAFNGASCAVCHSVPAIGGVGVVAEVRAAAATKAAIRGARRRRERSSLFHIFSTRRMAASRYSAGGERDLAARADPAVRRGPRRSHSRRDAAGARGCGRSRSRRHQRPRGGISISARRDCRVGRFGWKSQHATLLAFGADAYRNEMGITNDSSPRSSPRNQRRTDELCDRLPDPRTPDRRTRRRGIDNFESFMKFLAAPGRGPIDDAVRAGEAIFTAVGCASCHVPALQTGADANPLFHHKVVPLFSDLLLHDIGTGDGIRQEAAARRSSGRRRCGACGIAGRCCTTGRPPRSKTRSACMPTRPSVRAGSWRCRRRTAISAPI